jgi:ribonuclease HII
MNKPLNSYLDKKLVEAGCDEAGRGCLAGPVFAASVILPKKYKNKLLNDSKKLNEKTRNMLRYEIEKEAISWSVSKIEPEKIDEINILNASFAAMHGAIDTLNKKPQLLLIDGNRFVPYKNIPHKCIVKGDGKYLSIAAASVLAKTYRDEYMLQLHESFPQYNWAQNKGYPTIEHRKAIESFGSTQHHRKSFMLLRSQFSLDI